jgi:hypothetical protein
LHQHFEQSSFGDIRRSPASLLSRDILQHVLKILVNILYNFLRVESQDCLS